MPRTAKKPSKGKRKATASATKRARASQIEFEARAAQVLRWLLNGAPRYEILRLSAEKWKIEERQTDTYIARAHDYLTRSLETDRIKQISLAVAQRQGLYALALESGDFKGALAVLADTAKLFGLYAPVKAEVTGKDGGPVVTVYIPANGREVK